MIEGRVCVCLSVSLSPSFSLPSLPLYLFLSFFIAFCLSPSRSLSPSRFLFIWVSLALSLSLSHSISLSPALQCLTSSISLGMSHFPSPPISHLLPFAVYTMSTIVGYIETIRNVTSHNAMKTELFKLSCLGGFSSAPFHKHNCHHRFPPQHYAFILALLSDLTAHRNELKTLFFWA